jgi:hypothetical protein
MAVHGLQKATNLALTREIMDAVEEHYYESLNDPDTGYSELHCVDFLTHLKTACGRLRDQDIEAYNKTIKEKWDKSLPMESVFNRITGCGTALANTTLVCDRATVLIVVAIMKQAGHFTDVIKEWNRKPLNDRTCANSKPFS